MTTIRNHPRPPRRDAFRMPKISCCSKAAIVVRKARTIARRRRNSGGAKGMQDNVNANGTANAGDLDEQALFFHRHPRPGKLEIQPTKPLGNQRDLALAYSPGVAAPCLAIRDDPNTAADYTARAN